MHWRSKYRVQTMKLLEENIWENLGSFGFDNELLDATQKSQSMKEKIGKLNFIKIKTFCSVKTLLKEWKDSHRLGDNICKISD